MVLLIVGKGGIFEAIMSYTTTLRNRVSRSHPHVAIEAGLRSVYNISGTACSYWPEEIPMKVDVYSSPT
jgi:hypothetical protein